MDSESWCLAGLTGYRASDVGRQARTLSGTPSSSCNRLLATLAQRDWDLVRPHLTRVRLVSGQILIERGHVTEHVFFIEEGLASLIAGLDGVGNGVQVAMIGREGLVGGFALLEAGSASYASAIMQIPGPALRIPTLLLRNLMDQSLSLHRTCLQYVQSMTHQVMQMAASNALNTLLDRYVRWLLMAHDRMGSNELHVTHETLALLLGVRRSGITVATAALQEEGLIQTSRGRITILDRSGLETMLRNGRRRSNALTHARPAPLTSVSQALT